jgi:nucleoside-diphosphate-sugar epimerase
VITVLGSQGFVGSHLVELLTRSGQPFQAIARGTDLPVGPLGHVIYCIGFTGDFRARPLEAAHAHVCVLLDVLTRSTFDSFLYLSSVRVYAGGRGPAREEDDLTLNPLRADDIYNASKALGESIVLSLGPRGRVARPSNVYGAVAQRDTFIGEVVEEATTKGSITFRSPPDSSRDFVTVEDVARLLVDIAVRGRERIYNVASGISTTNAELGALVARETGCSVGYAAEATPSPVPSIDVRRIRDEFGYSPAVLGEHLPLFLGTRQ